MCWRGIVLDEEMCVQCTVYTKIHSRHGTGGGRRNIQKALLPDIARNCFVSQSMWNSKICVRTRMKCFFCIFVICHNLLPPYWRNFAWLNLIATWWGGCWWNQWQYIETMMTLKSRKRHQHVEDCSISKERVKLLAKNIPEVQMPRDPKYLAMTKTAIMCIFRMLLVVSSIL